MSLNIYIYIYSCIRCASRVLDSQEMASVRICSASSRNFWVVAIASNAGSAAVHLGHGRTAWWGLLAVFRQGAVVGSKDRSPEAVCLRTGVLLRVGPRL